MLCAETLVVLSPFVVPHSSLMQIREGNKITGKLISTAQGQIGLILGGHIPIHLIKPVGVEITVLIYPLQLFTISYPAIHLYLFVGVQGISAIEVTNLIPGKRHII